MANGIIPFDQLLNEHSYLWTIPKNWMLRQLPNNNIPRATTRDCPYNICLLVGAIPCGCPLCGIFIFQYFGQFYRII